MLDDPRGSIEDLLFQGRRRSIPGRSGGPGDGHAGDGRPDRAEAILTPASDVRPERIEWAWRGRIPFGAVTLVVGEPGLGKSTILVDLCARLTRGQLEGDVWGAPVGVIVASAEDHRAATIVPRFSAAGADLTIVRFVDMPTGDGVTRGIILPDDISAIERQVSGTGVRVLVVDPLVAHLPGTVNSWRDQDVRRALAPLKQMAENLHLGVIAVVHLNKSQSDDVITRVSGSIGIVAAARSVFLVARDPEDEAQETCFLAHAKSNVSPLSSAFRFRVEGREIGGPDRPIPTSGVVWLEEAPGVRATDLLVRRSTEERSAVREAVEWLREFLTGGPRQAGEVYAEARLAGIARRTLERAKSQIGVRSRKDTFRGEWSWSLPNPQERQDQHEDHQHQSLGDLGAEPSRKAVLNKTSVQDRQVTHIGDLAAATPAPGAQGETAGKPSSVATAGADAWGIVDHPAPCPACGHRRFWRFPSGAVRCGVCHPPAAPRDVAWLAPVRGRWRWIRAEKERFRLADPAPLSCA